MIPKSLRDEVGMRPGEVEVVVEGAGLRVAPIASEALVERDGMLVIPSGGAQLDDASIRALRDCGQR